MSRQLPLSPSRLPLFSQLSAKGLRAMVQAATEVSVASSDAAAVAADNQRESAFFAAALQANNRGDAAGLTNNLAAVSADQQSSVPDFAKLRVDLGLPPPAA